VDPSRRTGPRGSTDPASVDALRSCRAADRPRAATSCRRPLESPLTCSGIRASRPSPIADVGVDQSYLNGRAGERAGPAATVSSSSCSSRSALRQRTLNIPPEWTTAYGSVIKAQSKLRDRQVSTPTARTPPFMSPTGTVRSWDRLSNRTWPTLLIGNGASINISTDFAYSSLLTNAHLDPVLTQLFADLATADFESVLESLWHADRVLAALNRPRRQVNSLYAALRTELAQTVRRVHVAWSDIPRSTFTSIAGEITSHDLVFTLNYDLLLYWSIMQSHPRAPVGDFFWNAATIFDPTDVGLATGRTGILYLHGGLHLWVNDLTGQSGKWSSTGANLLSGFGANLANSPNRRPLFVSEGTSLQKLRAIRKSEYLSFARSALTDDAAATVVFGASFGPQDAHVVRSLRIGGRRNIAISILPGTNAENVSAMAQYRHLLPDQSLFFFDARTHPLGDSALRVL
jgi:hypothetical protein